MSDILNIIKPFLLEKSHKNSNYLFTVFVFETPIDKNNVLEHYWKFKNHNIDSLLFLNIST